jgi:hypothetical protein
MEILLKFIVHGYNDCVNQKKSRCKYITPLWLLMTKLGQTWLIG